MAEPFVAEIRPFPFTFAPRGWALCNGQVLPISQNTALFSLLGTTYGGNGSSTFALPNLQGAAPMHAGRGPGLSQRFLGESGGSETVTLLQSEMPSHAHAVPASADPASYNAPSGGRLLAGSVGGQAYVAPLGDGTAPAPTSADYNMMATAGGGLPHNNMAPYLTLNFCIALQGVFPPRW